MKKFMKFSPLVAAAMHLFFGGSISAQEVGSRIFYCVPVEAYELTSEGLRMASRETYEARIIDREFFFDETTGTKSEPQSGIAPQYTILNGANLLGSPVVAQYGNLSPTFLRIQWIDPNDAGRFVFFLFGGAMNLFGTCEVQN